MAKPKKAPQAQQSDWFKDQLAAADVAAPDWRQYVNEDATSAQFQSVGDTWHGLFLGFHLFGEDRTDGKDPWQSAVFRSLNPAHKGRCFTVSNYAVKKRMQADDVKEGQSAFSIEYTHELPPQPGKAAMKGFRITPLPDDLVTKCLDRLTADHKAAAQSRLEKDLTSDVPFDPED